MTEKKKTFRQVCKCEKCGNEAEMVVTCSLVEEDAEEKGAAAVPEPGKTRHVKGTGTCSHCGNEADMWIDI
ncbi:hypothetical protein DENIS_4365 [Desulfonema ishimotonii]|uniref:Uncharacterized protein n=2 Tax=Desulfonema ishimotonii TaxID=45657 RepID=A0A401G2H8_9BACT|nr:hypothetical protein DENIS_4365 [Desulfonema ishimotonii]